MSAAEEQRFRRGDFVIIDRGPRFGTRFFIARVSSAMRQGKATDFVHPGYYATYGHVALTSENRVYGIPLDDPRVPRRFRNRKEVNDTLAAAAAATDNRYLNHATLEEAREGVRKMMAWTRDSDG